MARTIVVIGGGVAGLVAARQLALDGHRVTVLEAGERFGGAVCASTLVGVEIDTGAEAYAVTRPETRSLIDELGLTHDVVQPRRSDPHLLLAEGLYAMPHAMLGVPTDLSAPSLINILGESEAASARSLDAQDLGPLDPSVTLGSLVRLRMGDAVADRILTPIVAGVHAANPDLVECEAVVPGLLRAVAETGSLAAGATRLRSASQVPGAAIAGLRGGMTTLIRALEKDANRLGVSLRANALVRGVSRNPTGWSIKVDDNTIDADDLVLAVDAVTAARLLEIEPDSSQALSRIAVGDVAVVAMVLAAPELDEDPIGSGLLVAPGHPSVAAKALTHATAKWAWIREAYGPGHHLLRLSYGRDGKVQEDIHDLPEIARSDVRTIFALENLDVLDLSITRWDRSLVFPRIGHRDAVAKVRAAVAAAPNLAVIGAGIGGNGLAGTIALARAVPEQLER